MGITKNNKENRRMEDGQGSTPWSDLPQDLLLLISDTLPDRHISNLRLHSVCSTWRSTVFLEPRFPPRLVHPSTGRYLSKRTVFALSPSSHHRSTGSGNSESTASWLLKVEDEAFPGKKSLCYPLSGEYVVGPLPTIFPRTIDLLEFDVVELGHEYIFWSHDACYDLTVENIHGDKLAVCNLNEDGDYVVLALEFDGSFLSMYRPAVNGGMHERVAYDETRSFADLITFNGMFYVVDLHGTTYVIQPETMEVIQTLPNKAELCGNKKRLVICEGDLLLIDICTKQAGTCCGSDRRIRIKLLKLHNTRESWVVESGSLRDQLVFLGEKSSFSVPASVLSGSRGNLIVFEWVDSEAAIDGGEGLYNGKSVKDDALWFGFYKVYDLESGKLEDLTEVPELMSLFWPPPSWLLLLPKDKRENCYKAYY